MKSFLSIILFFSSLYVFAQDTLYFHSGDKQVVELIAIDKQAGLIYYEIGDKKEVRTINSIKSYTNHSNVENVQLFNNSGTVEPVNTKKMSFQAHLKTQVNIFIVIFLLELIYFHPFLILDMNLNGLFQQTITKAYISNIIYLIILVFVYL